MRGPEEWPSRGSNPADRIRLTGPAANNFLRSVIKVSILYPHTPGARFHLDYYISKHMPRSIELIANHEGHEATRRKNHAGNSLMFLCYARSSERIGKRRTLFPVAAKIAFVSAGATGGTPGSPTPVGFSLLGTICTSISGVSLMRSIS